MGFQESAPRPRSAAGPSSLGWWVALVATAVAGWLWIEREPEAAAPSLKTAEPLAEIEPASAALSPPAPTDSAATRRVAELDLELRHTRREVEELYRENNRLRTELDEARNESARYQQGLDQAVGELNQVGAELDRADQESRGRLQQLIPPPPADTVRPVGPPFVSTSQFGFVLVSGNVFNPTDYVARGSLEVSLVGSAGVVETRRFPMHIQPQSTERYDITFPNIFPTERLAARAFWVE